VKLNLYSSFSNFNRSIKGNMSIITLLFIINNLKNPEITRLKCRKLRLSLSMTHYMRTLNLSVQKNKKFVNFVDIYSIISDHLCLTSFFHFQFNTLSFNIVLFNILISSGPVLIFCNFSLSMNWNCTN